MKRTTIMVDEELLYDLLQLARQQNKSTASIIREALELYVIKQQEENPVANPLPSLAGLEVSASTTDVADGGDEVMLTEGADTITGWSVVNNGDH